MAAHLSMSLSSSPCFVLAIIQGDVDVPDDIERSVGICVLAVGATGPARTASAPMISPSPRVCFGRQARPPRRCRRAQPLACARFATAEVSSCRHTGASLASTVTRSTRTALQPKRPQFAATSDPAHGPSSRSGRSHWCASGSKKASSVQTGKRVADTPGRKATSRSCTTASASATMSESAGCNPLDSASARDCHMKWLLTQNERSAP
jgi:hypothetical protein